MFFSNLGERIDRSNAKQYIVRTLDDFFPWKEPEDSSCEDLRLETEMMKLLRHFSTCASPIVLFLTGNETSTVSRRVKDFIRQLRVDDIEYFAFCEYEHVAGQVRENFRELLSLDLNQFGEHNLKSMAKVVNDEDFERVLVRSRTSLAEQNHILSSVCSQWHRKGVDDISGLSSRVRLLFIFV